MGRNQFVFSLETLLRMAHDVRKKNSHGPIIPEQHNLEIVQNRHFVDGTFLIDKSLFSKKDIYRELYREFKPEVITIGRNFFAEEAIYADIRGLGVKSIVKIEDDFESTSEIIERIRTK